MPTPTITAPRASWKKSILPGDFQSQTPETSRTARDWVVDWVLFLLSAAFGVSISIDQGDRLWLLNAITGVILCLSLFWRRSHPLAVGIIASIGSGIAGAGGLAWLIALYNSALRLDRTGLTWVIAIGAIGFFTYPLLYPTDMEILVLLVLSIGVSGVALGLGVLARARREHVFALAAASEAAEGEQRLREEQAREAERHRIAREMHDVLAHRISLLSLHAGALEYRPDIPPEDIAKTAGVIRAAAQDALQELRDVIGVMRTGADEGNDAPQPGMTDIPRLIERFRDAGLRIDMNHDKSLDDELSPTAGRTLYRVVQEGLTNASKHAPGSLVTVTIEHRANDRAAATIENPISVSTELAAVALAEPGVGLIGLGERLDLAGGTLKHGFEGGSRFKLEAEVPIDDA